MASALFGPFKESLLDRSVLSGVDLDTDTLKVLLLTSAGLTNYLAAINSWTNRGQAAAGDELTTGGGYTVGGITLGSVTVNQASGTVTFDAADSAWTAATFSAYGAVIYKSTGTAANDLLIAVIDFGGVQTVTAGTFTIQWNASGIFTLA